MTWSMPGRSRKLPSFAVDYGWLATSGAVRGEADAAWEPTARVSHGIGVRIGRDVQATVRGIDARGARISLAGGDAHADVARVSGARWIFDVGPVVVHVTGTASPTSTFAQPR